MSSRSFPAATSSSPSPVALNRERRRALGRVMRRAVAPAVASVLAAGAPAWAAGTAGPGGTTGSGGIGGLAGTLLGKVAATPGSGTTAASPGATSTVGTGGGSPSGLLPLASPGLPSLTTAAGGPASPGYWIVGSQGGVGAYGGTTFYGSMASTRLSAPIVGSAATPDGKGYWLVASDGGIFSFGDATYFGSMGGRPLAQPVVGMAATPDGRGYWLVAADGGLFGFGVAVYRGSMGGVRLAQAVVGMAATSDGSGYWLVAGDGGIFAFGTAPFEGSMGGTPLARPMVGMAAVPGGHGYWTVASDGGIFGFGGAPFLGSTGNMALAAPVVSMAPAPDGGGYWLVASDGGIFAFGDAPFRGSASGYVPDGEWITSMVEGPGAGSGVNEQGDFTNKVVSGAPYAHAATGYDISWPQCGQAYPPPSNVAVVGVTGGSAFTSNPCFGSEAAWGGPTLTLYMNLNSPQGSNSAQFGQGPAGVCAPGDLNCDSYNFGYNSARAAISSAQAAGHTGHTWWLDVETGNYWTSDVGANDQVIAGAIAAVHQSGYAAAIYSTNLQWSQIAGGYAPGVPVWYPTGQATSTPSSWCSVSSFAGGPVYLVQSAAGPYDGDYSC